MAEDDNRGETPDFDRGKDRGRQLERRFLEWAYTPAAPIDIRAVEVAHAIQCSIAEAEAHLEDLAARDALSRLVDDDGFVYFRLPGRKPAPVVHVPRQPLAPAGETHVTRSPDPQATMGLVLNLVFPGVGSIVAGKTGEGIAQLVLFIIGLPLCFVLIGIPLCVAVWGWALATGLRAMNESQQRRN